MIISKEELIKIHYPSGNKQRINDFSFGYECREDDIISANEQFLIEKKLLINQSSDILNQLTIAVEALRFSYAHLESMENYSLVTGARHHMNEALAKIAKIRWDK